MEDAEVSTSHEICLSTINEITQIGERVGDAMRHRAKLLEEASLRSDRPGVRAQLRQMAFDAGASASKAEADFINDAIRQLQHGVTIAGIRREAKLLIDSWNVKPVELVPTADEHLQEFRKVVSRFCSEVGKGKDCELFLACVEIVSGKFECDQQDTQRLLDECEAASRRLAAFIETLKSALGE
jgi:hypothetical protein